MHNIFFFKKNPIFTVEALLLLFLLCSVVAHFRSFLQFIVANSKIK